MDIKFVPQGEIDKVKWNSCVHYATNGNIFGYKWFLDYVAKDWDALVEGDYESVFPLVWKKNFFGQKSLYQPRLIKALGIFSIHVLSEKRIEAFLQKLATTIKKVDIVLNEQNDPSSLQNFNQSPLVNYQLLIKDNYHQLRAGYSPALKVKLDQIQGLRLTTSLSPEKVAEFWQSNNPKNTNNEQTFHALQRVMYNALHRGWGNASGVMDEGGNLLAVNFYLYSHGKAVSLVPITSKAGQSKHALEFLFDIFIRTNAGRPVILDFNSPDDWYKDFGAQAHHYFRLKR